MTTKDPGRTRIVSGTRNPDKVARIRALVPAHLTLVALPDGVLVAEPESVDKTEAVVNGLVAIASAKAVAVSVAFGGALSIATDGGLEIPGLGAGWDPVRTRRFAGPVATNRDRIERLLWMGAGLTGDERRIGWREAVAIAAAGQVVFTATAASSPGLLAESVGDVNDDGQGFWVTRLWEELPTVDRPPGRGEDHWDRLAPLVRSFLDGWGSRP